MSLALATSPAAVAPQDGICYFDKLPQELLDMVCDFAYGYQTERLIITKGQYMESREDLLEVGKLASIPPFEHHVDRFLVSKRFFLSAVEAYVKAQRLDHTAGEYYFSSDRVSGKKLFQLFAKDIKVASLEDIYTLRNFSSLRNIELVLDEYKFRFGSPPSTNYPWVHAFQPDDFAQLNIVKHIGALRGVQTFAITAGRCHQADTVAKKQMWQCNIDTLQTYLTLIVTARKFSTNAANPTIPAANSHCVKQPQPLYPGSRVSGTESALTKPTIRLAGPIPVLASQVMGLKSNELRQWIERALQENPELARPLEISDLKARN
ncbi:hypothetical protein CB0940_11506 [Cercospora beticola]|uniref:Uncharacterized protein n=1 Tax=Cercospora beticola TaxID=122368 RepID=A0A2G5HE45_CERBT|nr:hypothetical protein CB0940_11506 [Cercospora beticola]PIA90543.1 hypothetical protein CB0940_11506 [Cercospora beticola]WPB08372.1 hypothetical protein RHO25_013038 [Cercospora beticola]CAK1367731.1 unnamed protein product [Cercospora beticola]